LSRAEASIRTVLSILAALVSVSSAVAAAPPEAGRCPNLGAIHVVSFKGQESKIFDAVVAIGRESTKRAFDAPEIVRIYSDCLDSLKTGDTAEDAAVASLVSQIKISMSAADATVQVGNRPAFELQLSGPGGRLAKAMVGRVLRDLQVRGSERAAVANVLWFLWTESYVRSLGQRFDTYRYADELAEDAAHRLGRSYSVGFQPVQRDGKVVADEVFDETLRKAGLVPGTEIVALDDRPIVALSTSELSHYWLSPRPFKYRTTLRADNKLVELAADSVPRRHNTIAWTMHGDLAYLRVSRFALESIIELRRVLRAIEKAGARGVVIDVRSNPGGAASPGIIDCFLKPGQTTMSYRETLSGKEVDVNATVEYHGIPLVVLVDEHSASMAETFAAAMQIHKRGIIVGTQTFGKGVGQTIHDVLDEGTLHLVERTYFYPGTRTSWDGKGIAPDIVVEISKEQASVVRAFLASDVPRIEDPAVSDPALQKAFERLGAQP
jgi:C-terminal peptidase prc